jgi:hypothetical protein
VEPTSGTKVYELYLKYISLLRVWIEAREVLTSGIPAFLEAEVATIGTQWFMLVFITQINRFL